MTEQLWCCAHAGQRLGPLPFAKLRQMAAAGAIARTDLVWPDGRPEEAVPASTLPGLFPTAGPPAATSAPQAMSTPSAPATSRPAENARPLAAQVVGRVLDAAGGVLHVVCVAVGGIVVLLVCVGLFCGKGSDTTPAAKAKTKPLPVEVSFRPSAVGKGLVMRVKNVSADKTLTDLLVGVTAARGQKAGSTARVLPRPLEPGREVEVGWAELGGWQLAPGETVELSVVEPGYDRFIVTVPDKTGW